MNGFGLAFVRPEGAVAHPDDPVLGTLSDEQYAKQLRAYLVDSGQKPEDLFLSRSRLLN